MMHLVDGFFIIFILFQILFSLRLSFLEYLRHCLNYFIPYLLLIFLMGPIYKLMQTNFGLPNFIDFKGMHLVYYFISKAVLYLILVLIVKLIIKLLSKIFKPKINSKPKKWAKVANVFMSLMMGFAWFMLLFFAFTRLSLPTSNSYFKKIAQPFTPLFEVLILIEYQEHVQVYQATKDFRNKINHDGLEVINHDFDELLTIVDRDLNELLTIIGPDSLAYFTDNKWVNINEIYKEAGRYQAIIENEKNNKEIAKIKKLLNNLKDYDELALIIVNHQDLDGSFEQSDILLAIKNQELLFQNKKFQQAISNLIDLLVEELNFKNHLMNFLNASDLTEMQLMIEAGIFTDNEKFFDYLHLYLEAFSHNETELDDHLLAKITYAADDDLIIEEAYLNKFLFPRLKKDLKSLNINKGFLIASFDDLSDEEIDCFIRIHLEGELSKEDLINKITKYSLNKQTKDAILQKINE